MRKLILFLTITISLFLSAKDYNIKYKSFFKPFNIKIEKIEIQPSAVIVFGKIKQMNRFSYSIDFENCYILNNGEKIYGQLIEWNNNPVQNKTMYPISDEREESFILSFPGECIPQEGTFDLKLGTIQNKDKSDLILTGLTIEKKKK